MNMISYEILLYLTFVLLTLVTARCIYLQRCFVLKNTLLEKVQENLETARTRIEELRSIEKKYNSFGTDLEEAALASRAKQTPRVLNNSKKNFKPPERYKYVHSLTQQGIASAEIATILAISAQEADQLVSLANLSNN